MLKKFYGSLALLSALAMTPAYSLEVPNGDFEEGAYEFHSAMWNPTYKAASIEQKKSAGDGHRCLRMDGTTGKSINVYFNRTDFVQTTRKFKLSYKLYRENLPANVKNAGVVTLRCTLYPAKGRKNAMGAKTVKIASLPAKKWTEVNTVFEVPAGVKYNKFGFLLFNRNVPTGVTVYVDDITLTPLAK